MRFQNFRCFTSWKWFVIFPTIVILRDEPQYFDNNFAIQVHWLGFHLRWFWIKEYYNESI